MGEEEEEAAAASGKRDSYVLDTPCCLVWSKRDNNHKSDCKTPSTEDSFIAGRVGRGMEGVGEEGG